jgi:hypothetical protein
MRKSITIKAGAVATAFVLSGSLAVIASGTTGAYFSDTKAGEINGSTGSIEISTVGSSGTGVNNLSFSFEGLMPGVAKTATVNYKNIGKNTQDIYLTFPNVPALHALNNLGSYGEVHVVANGTAVFDSVNLQDGRHQTTTTTTTNTCGPFGPGGCNPLMPKLLVASDVLPGVAGTVSFSFNYPTKLSGNGTNLDGTAGVFNSYPLSGMDVFAGSDGAADAAGPADSGLPVNVVAVQVDQQP